MLNQYVVDRRVLVDGRLVSVSFGFDNQVITLFSIYMVTNKYPNVERYEVIRRVEECCRLKKDDAFVFMGDFNKIKGGVKSEWSRIMNRYNAVDAWDERHEGEKGSTHKSGGRLDRIFVDMEIMDEIGDIGIENIDCSDHDLLLVGIKKKKRSKECWRMPLWLLNLEEMDEMLIKYWGDFGEEEAVVQKWDEYKLNMICFMKRLARNRKFFQGKFAKKLYKNVDMREVEKAQIEEIFEMDYESQQGYDFAMRYGSRIKEVERWKWWVQDDGKRSKRYEMREDNGEKIVDEDEILKRFHVEYEKRFGIAMDLRIEKKLYEGMPVLTSGEAKNMRMTIVESEVENAIAEGMNEKSPGPDGIVCEFYKAYKNIFVPVLSRLFNEIITYNKLPASFHDSYTIMIPKKEKCKCIDDYRPISLVNTDYKIFARIIAKRMASHLGKMISCEQLYALPLRKMHHAVQLLNEIIKDAKSDKTNLVLLSLDIQKAFDSGNYSHIYATLKYMKFDTEFVQLIMRLILSNVTRIKLGNRLSEFIKYKRGLRQGDPLSALLFVISMEAIILRIKEAIGEECFKTGDFSLHLLAYADDIVCTMKSSDKIQDVLDVFERYHGTTGYNLNREKTKYMCYLNDVMEGQEMNIEEVKRMKILGEWFGLDAQKISYERLIDTITKEVKKMKYKMKYQPYQFKIQMINNMCMSHITQFIRIYRLNERQIKAIDRILINAFWDGEGIHWLARTRICRTMKSGGLKFPNIKVKILMQYVDRLMNFVNEDDNVLKKYDQQMWTEILKLKANSDILFLHKDVYSLRKMKSTWREIGKVISILEINMGDMELDEFLVQPIRMNGFIRNQGIKVLDYRLKNCECVLSFMMRKTTTLKDFEYKEKIIKLIEKYWSGEENVKHRGLDVRKKEPLKRIYGNLPMFEEIVKFFPYRKKAIYEYICEKLEDCDRGQIDDQIYQGNIVCPKKWSDYVWRRRNKMFVTNKKAKIFGFEKNLICILCKKPSENDFHIFEECERYTKINEDYIKFSKEKYNMIINKFKDNEELNDLLKKTLRFTLYALQTYVIMRAYGRARAGINMEICEIFAWRNAMLKIYINVLQNLQTKD